jgi:hypothetical protein
MGVIRPVSEKPDLPEAKQKPNRILRRGKKPGQQAPTRARKTVPTPTPAISIDTVTC